jgi:flagellar hook protein FlgE
VTAINGTTITLSGKPLALHSTTGAANITFKHALSMTLVTPEGTEIPVTGATNKKTSGEVLTTTTSQVEVFASIDGKFYDYDDLQALSQTVQPFLIHKAPTVPATKLSPS